MGLWQKVKASWMEEYNRPLDIYNIPCGVGWFVSITLLCIGWWRIGLWTTIKTYWWAIPLALIIIFICDNLSDMVRKRHKLTYLSIIEQLYKHDEQDED